MKLICIKCPRGCELSIDNGNISGNMCPRGLEYAKEELTCPKRIVTYLVKSKFGIVPVKTNSEVPKDKVFEVVEELSKIYIENKVNIGDVIIKNILSTNVDIVVTGFPYKN